MLYEVITPGPSHRHYRRGRQHPHPQSDYFRPGRNPLPSLAVQGNARRCHRRCYCLRPGTPGARQPDHEQSLTRPVPFADRRALVAGATTRCARLFLPPRITSYNVCYTKLLRADTFRQVDNTVIKSPDPPGGIQHIATGVCLID